MKVLSVLIASISVFSLSVNAQDLSKLSQCSFGCVLTSYLGAHCAGLGDTKCICTETFTNSATDCLLSKCPASDVVPALNLEIEICPNLGLPNLSGLSNCTTTCVLSALQKTKCRGPLDRGCICSTPFVNTVTGCLTSNCPTSDVVPALNLEQGLCPSMQLPDLSKVSPCAQSCVISTLTKTKCAGPLDKNCICGIPFGLNAAACLLTKCGLSDVGPALGLQIGICKPSAPANQCTATGLWRLLQPACWFSGGRLFRRGTADAISARRIAAN